jgi:hypothetical protein
MFNLIEPGHVLRFGVDPRTIISPPALTDLKNDNTLESAWPTTSHLGLVECISHPSGDIGDVAADVATHLRMGSSKSRSASYSAIGRAFTSSNRVVGSINSDFVGYTEGRSWYIPTTGAAMSKDFSGCLFVSYSVNGEHRVAHAASASASNPRMDCKQAFLHTLQAQNAVLHGWFRPYDDATDLGAKIAEYQLLNSYMNNQINNLVTFGAITAAGVPYSINAFKPYKMGKVIGGLRHPGPILPGNDWVVTSVHQRTMTHDWDL